MKIKKKAVQNFTFDSLSAVREGFEPSVPFPVRQFSKLFLSATQAPHRFAPANVLQKNEFRKKLDIKITNY